MKKRIYAIIGLIVAMVMVFTACATGKDNEAANGTTADQETVSVAPKDESTSELITVETTKETTTEATTAATTQSTTKAQTTTKKAVTTTKKPVTTTKKPVTATKKAVTTTKKKVTTTKKAITTKKNVTAKEVQQKVNNYIKSKGIKLDSSLTPKNAGWSTTIYASQERLNNGRVLKDCKGWVDLEITECNRVNNQNPNCLYCYYDSEDFYILYL